MRKLYRHAHGEKHIVGGVFSGLGEWLEVSPGILRVGYLIMLVLSGVIPAMLLYLAAMFMMKKHPDAENADKKVVDI